MKKTSLFIPILVILFICPAAFNQVHAQSIKILGGNTLNGAINGTLLGGATMALQNSSEFAPLRVGLGAGTIYGLSVGIYDMAQVETGQRYYVSGTFNDGDNSTILVLLDTIYGAAGGAVVATAFNLIADQSLEEGLQYGAGAGAWVGFGFGLVDAFLLSERAGDFQTASRSSSTTSGLITLADKNQRYNIGFLNPRLHQQPELSSADVTLSTQAVVDLVDINIQF